MGFIWSKPRNPLQESLITDYPVFLRMGDLLLIPASDLDIALNRELWKNVALVISSSKLLIEGQVCCLKTFISECETVCARQLECARPSGFDKKFVSAIAEAMSLSYTVHDEFKEGFQVAYVLSKLGITAKHDIEALRPHHFSSDTPFHKIDLRMYTENLYF